MQQKILEEEVAEEGTLVEIALMMVATVEAAGAGRHPECSPWLLAKNCLIVNRPLRCSDVNSRQRKEEMSDC